MIEVESKKHYGIRHIYVINPELKQWVAELTEKICLNEAHISALKKLGHEVVLVSIDGKPTKEIAL